MQNKNYQIALTALVAAIGSLLWVYSAWARVPVGIIKIFEFPASPSSPPFIETLMDNSTDAEFRTGSADQLAKEWFLSGDSNTPEIDLLLIHEHYARSHLWRSVGTAPGFKPSTVLEPVQIPGLSTLQLNFQSSQGEPIVDSIVLPWVLANGIPLFTGQLPENLIPQQGQSAKQVLTQLAEAGYALIENELPSDGTIGDLTAQIKRLVPELKTLKTGAAGPGAVLEVAKRMKQEPSQKVFTFFGIHPYAMRGQGVDGIHLYHVDDPIFSAPIVPLVKKNLSPERKAAVFELLSYLASDSVQKRASEFRFTQPKEVVNIPTWIPSRSSR